VAVVGGFAADHRCKASLSKKGLLVALRQYRPTVTALRFLLILAAFLVLGTASYTVKPGDTLSEIARSVGVSVRALAAANGIANPDFIRDGTVLTVPSGSADAGSYRVVRGDTLSHIARRHGVSTSTLAAHNGMRVHDLLREGRTLSIPAGGTASGDGGRAEIGALLRQTAGRYGLSSSLVQAVAWQESGWNNSAVSSADARGVMQVLPSTGRFIGGSLLGRPVDLDNTADNIEAGVAFLAYLGRLTGGDERAMLAGYYQGLRSVRVNGIYDETVRYVDNVQALRGRFS
jgi:LysM repeat protein